MMEREELKSLLNKYNAGDATDAEKRFVEAYFDKAASGPKAANDFNPNQLENIKKGIFENILDKTDHLSPQPKVRHLNWQKYAAVAAVLVAAVSITWWTMLRKDGGIDTASYITSSARAGQVSKIKLSDGTLVWLNASSKLRYPQSFEGSATREIYLDGEAYFEVAHDKKHPFMVHSKSLTTRVLGTKFDVKAYKDENRVEVTLLEGKVMLTANNAADKGLRNKASDTIYLKPNEKAVYLANGFLPKQQLPAGAQSEGNLVDSPTKPKQLTAGNAMLSKAAEPFAKDAIAWKNWDVVYRDETVETVIKGLERRYDIEIKTAPYLLEKKISIKINNMNADEAILEVTRQIKRMLSGQNISLQQFDLQYKKVGNTYYIE